MLSPRETKPVHALSAKLPVEEKVGTRIEISPESQFVAKQLVDKMDTGSAWLNIDYGSYGPAGDSLRVIELI